MRLNQKRNSAFTLVELLIVIALLGVLAAAVLAAINPLEQANRARDSRMRSDASQLLAAIDRYYVAQDHFPWVTDTSGYDDGDEFGFFTASNPLVGICADADCANGLLITNNELKTEFTDRDFISATEPLDMLYVGKGGTATGVAQSVYACWVPRSRSERAKAHQTLELTQEGMPNDVTVAGCQAMDYETIATSCVRCLPE